MNGNPLVTMLVASHNKGRWLASCLWSIFNQSYRPIETVVCDNGSTDQSEALIRVFESAPGFKCLFHPEALGVSRAINACLEKATGEYVGMLGADDEARPDFVEGLMRVAFSEPDADMIFGDLEEIDEAGKVTGYGSAAGGFGTIFDRCSIGHASSVVKKSVYNELGGYDENLKSSVDWEFIVRLLKAGKRAVYSGTSGYRWRRHAATMTRMFGLSSETRKNSHSYIRRKHGLSGKCSCGCGAEG